MMEHWRTRAVATSSWSAGSRWKGCGSWVDSTTICGWRCRREIPGSARALSIQTPTGRSSVSLPYSTSFATSQQEMMLTPRARSAPSSRISRCLGFRWSGRETHHTQTWVSSRITARRPSPRWQQVPWAHGIRGPNPEGFGPQRWLMPRISRRPTLRPSGRVRMEGPSTRGRHARRRSFLSNVPARPNYRGSGVLVGGQSFRGTRSRAVPGRTVEHNRNHGEAD